MKCPICGAFVELEESFPIYKDRVNIGLLKIRRCEKGHVWRVKIGQRGKRKNSER